MNERGFTLVELMITVSIVSILSTLAVYGVRRIVANSKTAEARNSIGQIAKDASMSFDRDTSSSGVLPLGSSSGGSNALCAAATTTVPSSISFVKGAVYQSKPSDWLVDQPNGAGFSCLGFAIDQPQHYMYGYTTNSLGGNNGNNSGHGNSHGGGHGGPRPGNGSITFSATAVGDLNGDGITSSFTLSGSISDNTVLIAPDIIEVLPEE